MLTVKREDLERTFRAVREVERRMRNVRGHRARWTGHSSPPRNHWGTLDSAIRGGGTATVSLVTEATTPWNGYLQADGTWSSWSDSGTNRESVYCPPHIPGLPSGCMVEIERNKGYWFIRSPTSLLVYGLTTGAVGISDTWFYIDHVKSIIGPPLVSSSSDTLYVNNLFNRTLNENARVFAIYNGYGNGTSARWDAINADNYFP